MSNKPELDQPIEEIQPPELVKGGRYQIVPDGGGDPMSMMRVTNLAKTLSDTEGLMLWSERMLAVGMARRPDLVATTAALDPETNKATLNDVVRFAKRSAGDKVAAELGTAIHAATEAADLGEQVPSEHAERVAEYQRTLRTAGITVDTKYVEVVLVLADRNVAGTADRIVTVDGRHHIFDLKTGKDATHKGRQLEHCIQMTAYSRATSIYDPATGKHRPMPKVDQERAIICHLPANGDPCTLYWLNLSPELLDMALAVRQERNKTRQTQFGVPEVANAEPTADLLAEAFPGTVVDENETAALLDRRRQRLLAALPADVKAKWQSQLIGIRGPKAAETWTAEQMDAIERAFELPWTDEPAPPAEPVTTVADVVPLRPRPADELGKKASEDDLKDLRDRARRQSNGVKAWVRTWNEEAIAEGTAWKMATGPNVSQWSFECSRAGIYLARIVERAATPEDGIELVRRILATVLGHIAVADGVTIGGLIGACSVDEARRLADLAIELNTKQIEAAS